MNLAQKKFPKNFVFFSMRTNFLKIWCLAPEGGHYLWNCSKHSQIHEKPWKIMENPVEQKVESLFYISLKWSHGFLSVIFGFLIKFWVRIYIAVVFFSLPKTYQNMISDCTEGPIGNRPTSEPDSMQTVSVHPCEWILAPQIPPAVHVR